MTGTDMFGLLRGGLVVSCQAYEGEPLHGPQFMSAMARSAVLGGAAGVRVNGPADVAAVRAAVPVPVVGLWKDGDGDVYITPTLEHALTVVRAGADIVALDATSRPRPDGRGLAETIAGVHRAGALVMADVSTAEEGVAAAEFGADCVSTTLSGYTSAAPPPDGPDLGLVAVLAGKLDIPLFAEGRIGTPAQAARAIELGAHAVVVGGAITRPADITQRFARVLGETRS
ncbi:N-acetylmannosamine-6-phosphate 2-epimerase [Nonomuraea mesophila]|uniref:Putative N-acetylmannosamine-6-phosphate 2-epimerase n=1 Tax=Nonomuraea mesophila TaxID=2530382 RepID=A0A4R5EWC1_9ACTN|nr:N-acetylmannosamine-6-phosphate 2-epimerase [Nonomuraea mesophila]TDE39309.1 N-acetylmannosamine-6-phosphate 2-epimerase [Nonomuraea mesophila]